MWTLFTQGIYNLCKYLYILFSTNSQHSCYYSLFSILDSAHLSYLCHSPRLITCSIRTILIILLKCFCEIIVPTSIAFVYPCCDCHNTTVLWIILRTILHQHALVLADYHHQGACPTSGTFCLHSCTMELLVHASLTHHRMHYPTLTVRSPTMTTSECHLLWLRLPATYLLH